MILMTYLREIQGRQTAEVAACANLPQNIMSFAEHRGQILTDAQTEAIAKALGYEGNPADLYQEVEEEKAAALNLEPWVPTARGKLDSE